MKLRPILFFVVILYIRNVLSQECGTRKIVIKELMVNAFNTSEGQWPWHVAIYHKPRGPEDYVCGGTLVTKFHVLTALHCVKENKKLMTKEHILVKLGIHDLNSNQPYIIRRDIEMIHTIKNFTVKNLRNKKIKDLRNDIAILQLAKEAEFSNYVQLACVSTTKNLVGQIGTAVGWGFDETDQVSPILKNANFPVVDFYTCLKSDRDAFGQVLDEGIFCAGYRNGTAACNGDSGGGIFFKENDAWHLGGIVSFSIMRDGMDQTCNISSYGAFTKIHTYLEWIESVTMLPLLRVDKKKCRQLANLNPKKEFYLELDMPDSIQRGEVIPIQVLVFNFLEDTIDADVTMFNINGEFDFVENPTSNSTRKSKTVEVPSNRVKTISFVIKAKKLGEITIQIEAIHQSLSDAVERMLHVTPESRRYERIVTRLIDLDYNDTEIFEIDIDLPRIIDKNSVLIKFTLDPDLFGQSIKNLEDLIRESSGDGEDNMVNFVQNIFILDYLSATTDGAEQAKTKAISHIESGYKNQLKYRRPDGSFSALGSKSYKGSTFLTAFVVTVLKTAAKYITVDNDVVIEAFKWLESIQKTDGQFCEEEYVHNKDLQGKLRSSKIALTAFVLIAFNEHESIARQYSSVIARTMNYLAMNFSNMIAPYDLAIASYGLALGRHPDQWKFFEKLLNSISIIDFNGNIPYCNRPPLNVEVAGYAILSYIAMNDYIHSIPIMRWLYQQGYGHITQDIFLSLKAKAKMAEKWSAHKNDFRVKITHHVNTTKWNQDIPEIETPYLYVNKTNSKKILEQDIPDYVRYLKVEVTGVGHGLFNITYQYNLNIEHGKHKFNLDIEILNTSTDHIQHLNVCVTFKQWERFERSNMVQVEVFFASGMIVGPNPVKDLSAMREITHTESRFSGTAVVVYYASLGEKPVCFEVTATKQREVILEVPSYVEVYDLSNRDWFGFKKF